MPYGPAMVFGMGAVAILGFLLALFIAALFLWMGAKLIGIHDASIGKAMIAILGGGILAAIVGALVGVVLGPFGPVLGFLANIWVIKAVFNTDWLRAFLAWLLSGIIAILVMGILALLGLFTIGALAAL
ncbi:hypothetical protein [Thermococcus thioreducens]|uniref:Uncharacterized protein n=1 Tax=Thermococcus thioreducens TaxID=277988 RepID=A0A0Q2RE99_9EURY|nr:hypothetical protein [Thermococcus thioreducens]ASJ12834.1 hypothetical protein A3L14_08030 [Thermococcus thioreducens]KQH82302.1 hypothetical protein AMR53_06790 [Thermococcus thioreducens]SEV84571.1 hypothetical protein SAMN05216170_0339 [Thermococcus thioreducens]